MIYGIINAESRCFNLNTFLNIAVAITGLSLVIAILSSKSSADALSGLIQGSKMDNYYSKNKSKTKEVMLEKFIYGNAFVFMLCVVLVNMV